MLNQECKPKPIAYPGKFVIAEVEPHDTLQYFGTHHGTINFCVHLGVHMQRSTLGIMFDTHTNPKLLRTNSNLEPSDGFWNRPGELIMTDIACVHHLHLADCHWDWAVVIINKFMMCMSTQNRDAGGCNAIVPVATLSLAHKNPQHVSMPIAQIWQHRKSSIRI